MKVKGMLSVRLALLTGLVLLSGGAQSAGETEPGDAPQAIGAVAAYQEQAQESPGPGTGDPETGNKEAENHLDAPTAELNFGLVEGDSAQTEQHQDGAGNLAAIKEIDVKADNGESGDASTTGDSGHVDEAGSDTISASDAGNSSNTDSDSDTGNSSDTGSHANADNAAGRDGHADDSAQTGADKDQVGTIARDAQAEQHSAAEDQGTQTDAFDNDRVNINTATAEELVEGLKGIGPKKAQAIVVYRDKHGPFTNVEQLKQVKGIGPATLARNQDRLEL